MDWALIIFKLAATLLSAWFAWRAFAPLLQPDRYGSRPVIRGPELVAILIRLAALALVLALIWNDGELLGLTGGWLIFFSLWGTSIAAAACWQALNALPSEHFPGPGALLVQGLIHAAGLATILFMIWR